MYFNGTASETTIFVGGLLEKHTANGITEYRRTIQAGDQPVALYTRPTSGAITTQYLLLDHLGSVAKITNSLGTLDVAESFAAYGERRDASDWSGPPSAGDQTLINAATQRGYTFHTNAESSSLIHMNGRLADARTGRFLSPDPYVFQPMLTQGFNRYSYVNNNPLSMTDPSGFLCADLYASCVGSVVYSVFSFAKKWFGGNKRPPPKGCFTNVGGTGCYGKAAATKLFDLARDIYGLPRLGAPPVWGVGNGTWGSGECTIVPGCMNLNDEVIDQTHVPEFRDSWGYNVHFGISAAIGEIGGEIQLGSHVVLGGKPDFALVFTWAPAMTDSTNAMFGSSKGLAYEMQGGMHKLNLDELVSEQFRSFSINTPWGGGEIVYDERGRPVMISGGGPWLSSGAGLIGTDPKTYKLLSARDVYNWTAGPLVQTFNSTKKAILGLFE